MFEVETGKAVVELPTPHAGKITKIHVAKGSKVKVGDALLTSKPPRPPLAEKAAPAPAAAAPAPKAEPPAAKPAPAASKPAAAPPAHDENGSGPRPGAAARGACRRKHDRIAASCRQPGRPRAAWPASWGSTWIR